MYFMLLTMKPALGAMHIFLQVTAVIPACDTHNIKAKLQENSQIHKYVYGICFTCRYMCNSIQTYIPAWQQSQVQDNCEYCS